MLNQLQYRLHHLGQGLMSLETIQMVLKEIAKSCREHSSSCELAVETPSDL